MQSESRVSEVQVAVIKPNNGLVAFASFVLDDKIYLSSVGVHQRLDGTGYRLTYPTKKVGQQDVNLFHPITKELSVAVELAVTDKIKEVMNFENVRHDRA